MSKDKYRNNFRKNYFEYSAEDPTYNEEKKEDFCEQQDNFRSSSRQEELSYSDSEASEKSDDETTKDGFRRNELSYSSEEFDISDEKQHKHPKKKSKHKKSKFSKTQGSPNPNFRRNLLSYEDSDIIDESKSTERDITLAMINSWLKSQNTIKADVDQETPEKVTILNDSASESSPKPKAEKPERELVALATIIAEKVKIISHNNEVYYYDGKTYRIIKDEDGLLSLILNEVDATAFRAHATKMFKDIYTTIKADKRFEPKDYRRKLRESKDLITFNDCIINVKTGEKLHFSEEYLTFGAYDAVYKYNACPEKFLKFVEDCSGGDPEVKKRIIQATGYLLLHTNKGKVFFVLGTAPNSGKSVYGRLLEYLVGEDKVWYISPADLQGNFGLGYIQGKTICMSMDLPKGNFTAQAASIIKQISGGDKIYSNQKYDKPQNIRSNMRFVFSSNFPVRVAKSCDDEAFWDRMVIVPFLHSIPKAIANTELFDELTDEKSDIISYCLNSASELIENNYIFDHCQAAVEMKELWRNGAVDTAGSIEKFANTCIDFTDNSSDFIYTQTLYGLYEEFCKQMELPKVSYNDLRDWFIKSGCVAKRIHNSRSENAKASLCGIKIKGGITID